MLIFQKIRWKNLLSTGNYFTEINLNGNKDTLIVGENGSGKSTMLDALCFGLFGKPFRNINKPQLLNSINGKECVVEVEFTTNNKQYKVIRGIKPNKFEIYCDGTMLNQDAALRDYQEHLEKFILKLNYKSFTQIVILGSASFVPFMQLSASDRRAIIEDLLDIQIFSSMNSVLKERVSANKDFIVQKKHEIDLCNQKIELHQKHIDEQNQDTEQKILGYNKEIEQSLVVIEQLEQEIQESNDLIALMNERVNDKKLHEGKIRELTKLESQIENTISKFKKDIKFFETNDTCPTCRQSIAEDFKEKELVSLDARAKKCEEGLSELETKLLDSQNKLNEITEIQKDIQEKQVDVATKSATITATNTFIKKLNKEISQLSEAKTKSTNEKSELKKLATEMLNLRQDLKDLIEEKSYFEVASLLLKDTGIKTKIIKQYLPIINKLVNKYLATLDFFVNFNLDESFKETIKSRHRDDFTYNNFSEGEKQRIDMALMLTWRAISKLKNSCNTNLLILDETFDSSLDTNGTEELMKILHMLDDVNLFVISHKGDILQDKFSNVIRFKKEKNFSKVT